MTFLFGHPAGICIAFLVATSCAGVLNSNVFVIGRLSVAASRRGYLPSFLGRLGLPRFHGPQGIKTLQKCLGGWKSWFWYTRNNEGDDRQYSWVQIPGNEEDDRTSEGSIGNSPAIIPENTEERWNTPM